MNMSPFTASGHTHTGGTSSSSVTHHMNTSGFGDIKIHALYGVVKSLNHQLILSAGLSLPTGSTRIQGTADDMMYPNRRYPYAMQLGSGTFEALPCVSYLYQKNKFSLSGQASGIVRIRQNTEGYQLGNEATLNTWAAYQWLPFLSSSLRFEGTIADKISGKDPTLYAFNELSANTANYGGKRLNCAIGAIFQAKKGIFNRNCLGLEYNLPVYQNLNGTQMSAQYGLAASWAMMF